MCDPKQVNLIKNKKGMEYFNMNIGLDADFTIQNKIFTWPIYERKGTEI